jgi:CheY-like chemotaxis protein
VETPAAGKNQLEMQFIAPDARILAVDDIETNLTVLKGLLAPYQMKITLCTSGADAIELTKKQNFDFILMDHMMPGMNGIEAVAAIRALETQRKEAEVFPKGIPIIALTANAVSGMKEMFLDKGFNDYISKPLEISKLNELMAKWVPPEKQIKTADEYPVSFADNEELNIPGINVKKGIAMTGGTAAGYRDVLSVYYKDAERLLSLLSKIPGKDDLADFAIHVHALKSASGSIGADELSKEATELETLSLAPGGIDALKEKLPGFCQNLKKTADAIHAALSEDEKIWNNGKGLVSISAGGLHDLFLELKTAMEAMDIDATTRLLAELAAKKLDKET